MVKLEYKLSIGHVGRSMLLWFYAKNIHETDNFSIGLFFFKRAIILFFGQQNKSGCTVERLYTAPLLYLINIISYKKYLPKYLGLDNVILSLKLHLNSLKYALNTKEFPL